MSSTPKKVVIDTEVEEKESISTAYSETKCTTSTGNNSEMEVLSYHHFPAENIPQIWLNIYEKMDQDDKVTFSGAYKEWHDWVARKRTDILFPQVAVFLLGRIPASSLKQCRTICRSWTQKIDGLYQYYPSDPLLNVGTEYVEEGIDEDILSTIFSSTDEIKRFVGDMSGHPGNPLPGRIITLKWKVPKREMPLAPREVDRLRIEYWTALRVLLSKFGKYILDATFLFWENEVEIVDRFRNCLLNLPNLNRLTFFIRQEVGVEEYLRLNPLPRLQDLETVHVLNAGSCFAEIFLNGCLVPANVKVLWINQRRVPQALYSFFNLESLTVRSSVFMMEDLEKFRNLPRVPPLRELCVNFSTAMNALQVFTALEPFADTLTKFSVMSRLNPVDGINGLEINLPKLEEVNLDSYRGSFDLFVGLTSLQKLRIDKPYIERRHAVQIRDFEARLNESNIWELIPSLQEIRVRRDGNYKWYER
ncbi:unnamed protein product [Orchesella dallaii]|uniref:F-box domain-containing protein n=1 Tax=Orchesella dallaii TaxID=48710 RepID=A0ABP1RQR1_9HEXA